MKLLEAVTQVALALEELSPPDRARVLKLALEFNDELHAELGASAKRGKRPPPVKSEEVSDTLSETLGAVQGGASTPAEVAEVLAINAAAAGHRLRKAVAKGLLKCVGRGRYEVA